MSFIITSSSLEIQLELEITLNNNSFHYLFTLIFSVKFIKN
jgi:hypothetical protein